MLLNHVKSVQKVGSDEHCVDRLSEMRLDNWPLDLGTGGRSSVPLLI